MSQPYDIIIFGGGIAGLFTACRLRRAGYNLILIEKDTLGGVQTLASQGMIHGGQKYTLQGKVTAQAASISTMPARWDACFAGTGDIDLSTVKFLSNTQVMFPAEQVSFLYKLLSRLTVFAAARAVNGKTKKLSRNSIPAVLEREPVYEMQEKVLDTKSLVTALANTLEGRIFKGEASEISDGQVTVDGNKLQAKVIIFTAGAGNEAALKQLNVQDQNTQSRPLRQIMVRPVPRPLYGHGIVGKPKPRVTVTSHPDGNGTYTWYLGGDIAEKSAKMPEAEAIAFAKSELQEIFPAIDWDAKDWATWYGDRAEAFDSSGHLPASPHIHAAGKTLIAWPTKLTFVPALADDVINWLTQNNIAPSSETPAPELPAATIGLYPWENATWHRL